MKKYLFLFTCLLFLETISFAQVEVKGKVSTKSGDTLPGVTIKEKYTENGTTTNIDGEFSITCLSINSTLIFSYVGFENKEVLLGKDTVLNVIMPNDGICNLGHVSELGLSTGLNNNQLGIKSQDLIRFLLSFQGNILLDSDFEWRFLTENKYLKFGISDYTILQLDNHNDVYLGLKVDYQQVSLENSGFSTKQYVFSSTISYRRILSSVGYAHREIKNHQDLSYSKNGIAFGLEKTLFRRLNLKANAIYWTDDWQYSFDVDIDIPKTRVDLGFGWEKINSWEEFDISILYSFFY